MVKINNYIKFVLLICIIAAGLLYSAHLFYRTNTIFSGEWDGYSTFINSSEGRTGLLFHTLSSRCVLRCGEECYNNNVASVFIFKEDYFSRYLDFCPNKTIIKGIDYNSGSFLYDIDSKEKRDDFIVGNYSVNNKRGEVLFRFPTYYSPHNRNITILAQTYNTTFADIDMNNFIDYRDVNGNFTLVYSVDGRFNDMVIVNNPSIFTNDLINKYDNKEFSRELFGMNGLTHIISIETPEFLEGPILFFNILSSGFNNTNILMLGFYTLLFIVIIVFIIKIVIKFFSWLYKCTMYTENESQDNTFYDTVKSIYRSSKENKHFYKWVIWMELRGLRSKLLSTYKDSMVFSSPTFEQELKSKYPALSAIDLKTIIFYLNNMQHEIDIKDKRAAKKLSTTISYVSSIIKRGF